MIKTIIKNTTITPIILISHLSVIPSILGKCNFSLENFFITVSPAIIKK